MPQANDSFQPQANSDAHELRSVFKRYYWLQIGLIALSILIGIGCSAWVMKGVLLKTALEQEMAHYWSRLDQNPNAPLPDTKNLYGYRWVGQPPKRFNTFNFQEGVQRKFVDGKERMTVYQTRNNQHVLLVFGESNVNKLVWFYGLAPLMVSLFVLYSFLWWSNRRAHHYFSPITRLANALKHIDWQHQHKMPSPFVDVPTNGNLEAEHLKQALEQYHAVLSDFIRREREFTGDVSHELRTPLTILKGSVQLCQTKYGNDRVFTRLYNTIIDMELLVDTLLAIARNKTQDIQQEQCYMSSIVHSLLADLEQVSANKGMHIQYYADTEEIPRMINTTIGKMVLSNVLRNALNYSHGSQIDIVSLKNSILIADNGIGMALPEDAKATELSAVQVHLTAKGHGIGLQLVQKLCLQLRWRVELFDRQYYLSLHPELNLAPSTGLLVVIYLS